MSIPKLSFENLNQRDPLSFAKILNRADIFERDRNQHTKIRSNLPGLVVSFARAGFFEAPDLAALAVILRRVAEEGKPVTINWPRSSKGQPSELEKYLERLRFADLFERKAGTSDWRERVNIRGRVELKYYPPDLNETTHYIPLRWFDKSDFLLIGEASIWKERPSVIPTVERELHSVLLQQGFADIDTIDILNRVLFLELGFNTVLHSTVNPGAGCGVFCAQIRHTDKRPPLLTFSIADAGRGIPSTLRSTFEKAVKEGVYYPDDTKTVCSNVVRFAFENSSSSRPEFPSNIDAEANRGLALVAESLMGRGRLVIYSDGAVLRADSTPQGNLDFQPDDSFSKWPIVGTQIVGTLRSNVSTKRLPSKKSGITKSVRFAVALCCEPNGQCSALASDEFAKAYVNSVSFSEDVLVFDLGFGEGGVRHLEYLCQTALSKEPDKLLIFWNVSTEWNQCESLCKWIAEKMSDNRPPPLFVRGVGDARILGSATVGKSLRPSWERQQFAWYAEFLRTNSSQMNPTGAAESWPVDLSLDDYLEITRSVNSAHLADGFRREDMPSGFFSGKVHMLSTRTVTKYFALSSHISASVDANLKRWISGSVAGIAKLVGTNRDPNKSLVILAFAGPMRHVLAHVPSRLPIREGA